MLFTFNIRIKRYVSVKFQNSKFYHSVLSHSYAESMQMCLAIALIRYTVEPPLSGRPCTTYYVATLY